MEMFQYSEKKVREGRQPSGLTFLAVCTLPSPRTAPLAGQTRCMQAVSPHSTADPGAGSL